MDRIKERSVGVAANATIDFFEKIKIPELITTSWDLLTKTNMTAELLSPYQVSWIW